MYNYQKAWSDLDITHDTLVLQYPVTFKNAKEIKKVVEKIDLKYLLSETDSPYLTPHPYRGQENGPKYIPLIVEQIASLKNIDIKILEKHDDSLVVRPLAQSKNSNESDSLGITEAGKYIAIKLMLNILDRCKIIDYNYHILKNYMRY